jgi:hypothetical protein
MAMPFCIDINFAIAAVGFFIFPISVCGDTIRRVKR